MGHDDAGIPDNGLHLADVRASYGHAQALFGIDLNVGRSEVVCLVGLNGMGKTTTLRAIMGLLPTEGRVLLDGTSLPLGPHERARMGIGYVPEDRRVFGTMNVEENLRVGIRAARASYRAHGTHNIGSSQELFELAYELFPRLRDRRRQLAGTLSGGEQQMLAVGRALVADPAYLLLDEPNEGLAPAFVKTISDAIREVRKQGVGVLLVEQSWLVARELGDRFYLVERGRTVDHTSQDQLSHDEQRIVERLGV